MTGHARPEAKGAGARIARAATTTFRWIGLVVTAICFLLVLGTLVPAIPWLGSIASFITAIFVMPICLLMLVVLVVAVRRQRRGGGRLTLGAGIAAALAIVGGLFIQASYLRVARANGVDVSVLRALWPGPSLAPKPEPRRFSYARYGGQALEVVVYPLPAGRTTPAPIIVYVHGGGWIGGDARMRDPDMRWFANRGYLVVSVNYSLSDADHHLWNMVHAQVGCALGWVGRHAARLGGDPRRMALLGDSAGGNLVLNSGYLASAGRLPTDCGPAPAVRAVVALYPVADPANFYHNPDPVLGGSALGMAHSDTGGSPARYPGRYAAITSANLIVRGAPPTLLLVGENDTLVPPEPAYAFVAKAHSAGVATELVRVPYANHGFDLLSGSIPNQLARNRTADFLSAHNIAPR